MKTEIVGLHWVDYGYIFFLFPDFDRDSGGIYSKYQITLVD